MLFEPIREYFSKKTGTQRLVVVVACAMALFHLYGGVFGAFTTIKQASAHLLFIMILVFLIFPLKKGGEKYRVAWYDAVAILLSIACLGYLWVNYEYVAYERIYYTTPLLPIERVFGIILIALLLEAARRTVGLFLVIVPGFFILYTAIGPYFPEPFRCAPTSLDLFLDLQYLTTSGIFGIPLGLSSTFLVLLIIFGALILETGFGGFLSDLAMGGFGRSRGGPAKVAVVSSAVFGMITGSSSANVAVTGTFTIPLMKRVGFRPAFAGAVEAVSSCGGQLMPPIMGAAAFVMAEYLGMPYIEIIKHAAIPAVLYFASLFVMVDLEAAKAGMKPIAERDDEPRQTGKQLLTHGHMFIPVVLLLYFMAEGRTVFFAVTMSIFAAVVLSMIRSATRLTPVKIIDAFFHAAQSMIVVAMACAVAGVMIASIYTTGLNEKFVQIIVDLSGSHLLLVLVAAMAVAIVLGMGMPTSAAYILMAALVIPALVKIGIPPLAAHMFGFYFACLSLITPPMAPASFVAAGIADSPMNQTAWTAGKVALVSYLIPFMFVYEEALLFVGPWSTILLAFGTALIGVYAFAVAIQGFWYTRLNLIQRIVALACALLLIKPGLTTDLIAFPLLVGLFFWERYKFKLGPQGGGHLQPTQESSGTQ